MVFPFAAALPAIITIGGAKVYDNYSQASTNADQQKSRNQDAANTYGGDKQIISNERSMLQGRFDGEYAGTKIVKHEDFGTWTHQEIWDALQGNNGKSAVKASDINAGADGWRRLDDGQGGGGGMREAVTTFRTEVERAIETHWTGKAATASMESTRAYGVEAEKLAMTFEMVANSIDLLEGALGHAKAAVGEPEDVSAFDKAVAVIPGTGLLKTAKHRADESSKAAQEVMKTVYQPVAQEVDQKTPVLAKAVSTFKADTPTDPGDGKPNEGDKPNGDTGEPSTPQEPTTPTTPTTPETPTTQETPTTTTPAATTPNAEDPTSTTPAATTPTTPAATTPAGTPTTQSPLGTGGSPGTGSPGGSPGTGTPGLGASLPGSPGQAAGTAAAARAGGTGAGAGRGMSGMPGMGAGAGRGGKGDDDSEHKIPDYLIQDRETELLGVQPRVLPPGGVIGE
ncbi:hypothetical protein ACFVVM_02505 [Nocardia sp. NPDC058176]|uniref:hypothetical protein n=1 Tax=Nocardia sp. NPDC058176 TaxID=3346368 RepID=UPI0036D9BF60